MAEKRTLNTLITRKIHTILVKNKHTVAVAESCTGGLLSTALTSLPGSSEYFILGIVAYSNCSKSRLLAISSHLLRTHGAVSESVCRKMASSIRTIAGTDFGIGLTGIAGPSGATPGKPVGTVYIAVCARQRTVCRKFLFKGNRETVRSRSCQAALTMLWQAIKRTTA